MRRYSVADRVVQGAVIAAFGLVLLAGRFVYGGRHDGIAEGLLAGPLVDSLFLLFTLLALVFIGFGIFMIVQALRRAAKARRGSTGVIDRTGW